MSIQDCSWMSDKTVRANTTKDMYKTMKKLLTEDAVKPE